MDVIEEAVEEGDRHRLDAFPLEVSQRRINVGKHERRMLAAVLFDAPANALAQIAWH
jgi:hypothetical protein